MPLLKNATVPVGAAPELPPDESALLLCVSTVAVKVTGVFAETVIGVPTREIVVGARNTVSDTAADKLLGW